jgi:hypothetical protein
LTSDLAQAICPPPDAEGGLFFLLGAG